LTDADVIFCDSAMRAVITRANVYPSEAAAKVYTFKIPPRTVLARPAL